MDALLTELLTELKLRLRFDEGMEDDQRLLLHLREGIEFLNQKAGLPVDFAVGGTPGARRLLYDYVRYAINDFDEQFNTNFLADIQHLQLDVALKERERLAHQDPKADHAAS